MIRKTHLAAIAALAALHLGGPAAHAATLSDLLGGGSLTEGDVIFENFFFDDRFTDDDPTDDPLDPSSTDREDIPSPGDRAVTASQIGITTTSTASSVTLRVEIDPAISISGQSGSLQHIFDFFLDFTVRVLSPSPREIIAATLGSGDLFAIGPSAFSEVEYAPGGFAIPSDRLTIFKDPGGVLSSVNEDTQPLAATNSILFEGAIEGETFDGMQAGLSTYSLTFDLSGTAPPPPNVVPLPASVVLLLVGLGGLGLVARRRRT